jgi:hypothetical protein
VSEAKSQPGCPICGAPRERRYRPFCSRRCADVDLNRWLSGRYALPAEEEEPADSPNRDEERAPRRKPG